MLGGFEVPELEVRVSEAKRLYEEVGGRAFKANKAYNRLETKTNLRPFDGADPVEAEDSRRVFQSSACPQKG